MQQLVIAPFLRIKKPTLVEESGRYEIPWNKLELFSRLNTGIKPT